MRNGQGACLKDVQKAAKAPVNESGSLAFWWCILTAIVSPATFNRSPLKRSWHFGLSSEACMRRVSMLHAFFLGCLKTPPPTISILVNQEKEHPNRFLVAHKEQQHREDRLLTFNKTYRPVSPDTGRQIRYKHDAEQNTTTNPHPLRTQQKIPPGSTRTLVVYSLLGKRTTSQPCGLK